MFGTAGDTRLGRGGQCPAGVPHPTLPCVASKILQPCEKALPGSKPTAVGGWTVLFISTSTVSGSRMESGAGATPRPPSNKPQNQTDSQMRKKNFKKKAIPPLPSPIFLWGVKIYVSFPLKYVIYIKCNGFVIVVILNLSNKCLKCPVLISSAENMDVYHPHKHKLSRFPHIFYFFPGMSRTLVT